MHFLPEERGTSATKSEIKLQRYSDDLPNVSSQTLSRLLRKLRFKRRKRSGNAYIVEDQNIVRWCCKNSLQVRKLRQQAIVIYYTDRSLTHHEKTRVWEDTTAANSSQARRS